MSQDQTVPPLSPETVTWLDAQYPERSPEPKDTEREIWMKAGERRLVRRLLLELSRQEETIYVHSDR